MQNVIITATICMSVIFSTLLAIQGIAEESAHFAIERTQLMQDALPCAFAGEELTQCAPDIYSIDDTKKITQTQEEVNTLIEQLEQN